MAAIFRTPITRDRAFRGFWIGLALLATTVVLAAREPTAGGMFGGALIVFAAFLPAYIWVRRRNNTIPIFPLVMSVVAVTHGFPLMIAPDIVADYSSAEHFRAGYTVAIPLLLATWIWSVVRRIKREPVTEYREIPAKWGDRFFLATLAAGVLTMAAITAGWTERFQESGVFTALRAALLACSALACLSLGFRHGRRELTRRVRAAFLVLLVANVVAVCASLLLNVGISYVVLAFVGFSLGRRHIPWLAVIPVALVFSVLHAGKEDMRDFYWYGSSSPYFSPAEYARVYGEWAHDGIASFRDLGERADSSTSILNRAGLIYLLLHVQSIAPERVAFLNGASYAHIPALLVPRLLYPAKPGAHDGTILLNLHFGLQTYDSVMGTTIGWGFLNEAYGNFGFLGALAVMMGLGLMLGLAERWSAGMPVLSFRSLFAILLLSTLIAADATLAVFIASFMQGLTVLLAASVLLMRRRRVLPESAMDSVAGPPLASAH